MRKLFEQITLLNPIALRMTKTLRSLAVLSATGLRCMRKLFEQITLLNPIALRTAKTLRSFGCSECNRVKVYEKTF